MERSGKGLITSLGFKAIVRPQKYKKARYAIGNVSKKDPLKIIKEFGKLPYESYEKKRPKYEPTGSYFYLSRHLVKCTMRADAFNLHIYPVITKMNSRSLHVCSTNEDESKCIIVHENLSQSCYTDEDKSKRSIINKTLSQICSAEKDELISKEEEKLECTITEKKYARSEVSYDVPNYLNVFYVFE